MLWVEFTCQVEHVPWKGEVDLLPAGFMLRLEGCFLPVLLAAEADKWIFHPLVTASDLGQRNRCKEWAPREEANQMGTYPRASPFISCLPWWAGEWRRDSSHVPEPMADMQQLQMHHRLLCLPSLSQNGFWSLYRVLVKPMPKWAWNRSRSG